MAVIRGRRAFLGLAGMVFLMGTLPAGWMAPVAAQSGAAPLRVVTTTAMIADGVRAIGGERLASVDSLVSLDSESTDSLLDSASSDSLLDSPSADSLPDSADSELLASSLVEVSSVAATSSSPSPRPSTHASANATASGREFRIRSVMLR